ncbi:hypothetical protein VCHC56A1_3377, partial [Vibrio cholerae HC-56A1]
MTFDIGFP